MSNVHATCVAFGKQGVLIRGASGAGKSTLALQLIDAQGFGLGKTELRAQLVSDDQTLLRISKGQLIASAPVALAGLIELRGLGIVAVAYKKSVTIKLLVDLCAPDQIERWPAQKDLTDVIEGIRCPRILIGINNPAAPALVRAALHHFV